MVKRLILFIFISFAITGINMAIIGFINTERAYSDEKYWITERITPREKKCPGSECPVNCRCSFPSLSVDGRFVAFESDIANLVEDDDNMAPDIFVYDRVNKKMELVSISTNGVQGNRASIHPSISGDGRYVVFSSESTSLVAEDKNGEVRDIFRHDRQTGITELVTVSSDGKQTNLSSEEWISISYDGRYVVFDYNGNGLTPNDFNGRPDVYIRDCQEGLTELISVAMNGNSGNGESWYPRMTPDGRYVAFRSDASNLIPNGTQKPDNDAVYLRDRLSGTTEAISLSTQGNLVTSRNALVSSISTNGRYVLFSAQSDGLVPEDNNGKWNYFIRDRELKTTEILKPSAIENDYLQWPVFSGDGKLVVFSTASTNLVEDDTNNVADVFLYNRMDDTIKRISLSVSGKQLTIESWQTTISVDGKNIAFISGAQNLMPDDKDFSEDVFVVSLSETPLALIHGRVTGLSDVSEIVVHLNGQTTITDSEGYFIFQNIPPGSYDLVAKKELCICKTQHITIDGYKPISVELELVPGDLNGDNRIDAKDMNVLTRIMSSIRKF